MKESKEENAGDQEQKEALKIEEIIRKPQLNCAYIESAWACEDRPCY